MLDVQCSMFGVHQFLFRLNWPLFHAGGAISLTPEHRHLKPSSHDNMFSEKNPISAYTTAAILYFSRIARATSAEM